MNLVILTTSYPFSNEEAFLEPEIKVCESIYQAWRSKVVNNTNVLCMGGFIIGHELGREMARAWLEAEYMVGLDPKMAEIVGKEFQELVRFEEEIFD